MKVTLIQATPNADKFIANIAKVCTVEDYNTVNLDNDAVSNFLESLKDWGHTSPFEHAVFTFFIEDISRACSHQLVRHRMASYTQRSQRYVNEANAKNVVPPTIAVNEELFNIFQEQLNSAYSTYTKLIEAGVPKEDARYLLPNACTTDIIVTMNGRSLFNFFDLRMDKHAQWEIRELATKMYELVCKVAPNIFKLEE